MPQWKAPMKRAVQEHVEHVLAGCSYAAKEAALRLDAELASLHDAVPEATTSLDPLRRDLDRFEDGLNELTTAIRLAHQATEEARRAVETAERAARAADDADARVRRIQQRVQDGKQISN